MKEKGKTMKITINYKKVVIWGIVVIILQMFVGNLLYQNPIVSGIYEQYKGHPSTKSMDYFGGLGNWLLLTMLFSIFLEIVFIILYLLLYKSIPGTGWKRGLSFGLMIGFIKAVPEAFNQWMLFVYPTILIQVQLINTLLSLVIFGILLAVIFGRFKVIEKGDEKND
ncbi:MAG: hypothetical protein AB1391_03985 [Candidatus Micrarchaeota archaeon]